MRKFGVIFICLACIIALFSVNNSSSSFSFETYLTNVSVVAEDRPEMPNTNNVNAVLEEYDETALSDNAGIIKSLKYIWTTLKLIYECFVFAVMLVVYLFEMIIYIIRIIGACTYNLFVW